MKRCRPPQLQPRAKTLFFRCAFLIFIFFSVAVRAQLPSWDFTTSTGRSGWSAVQQMTLTSNGEGFVASVSGYDPFMAGPARNYSAGTNLWLRLKLKSVQGGVCQVFWFPSTGGASEANSIKFFVPGGNQWFTARVPIPPLGTSYQLRIDPPGYNGNIVTLNSLWFEQRYLISTPPWPTPGLPNLSQSDPTVSSGELMLRHNPSQLGGFDLWANGQRISVGNTSPLLGYMVGPQTRWLNFSNTPANPANVQQNGNSIQVTSSFSDADGANWQVQQIFSATNGGSIAVETRLTVDRDRNVVYFPLFTLLSGMGEFGTNKTQALFPGVEYLENETSSSQLDLTNQWQRLVPDSEKITMPLMSICASNRYVGLIWEQHSNICAAFDSPDRQFNSGGHLMSILFPGSDGVNRNEGSLIPYGDELIRSNQTFISRATIIGGTASNAVAAVQKYIELHPLPTVPTPPMSASAYFDLAAQSWLNTGIRSGNLYRADLNTSPQPAADAALWMSWLSTKVANTNTAAQLAAAAQGAISQVPLTHYNCDSSGAEPPLVSHVRYPAQSLVFCTQASDVITGYEPYYFLDYLQSLFQADGSIPYSTNLVFNSRNIDYSSTHWSREASGFAAKYVALYLDTLSTYGDFSDSNNYRLNHALIYLQSLNKFRGGVPRGAQSWEVPLHAPDLLGAAYLVRAYTLAYELTQNPDYLEQAKYWAWTGVPFVYLVQPTPQPVGVYNTIPVLGASMWVAPNWIGLPVQWCGMVYADAIYRLVKYDENGPWKQLADGITVAGLQHTFPATDATYKGLLPDSFPLRLQYRDGAQINPADVLSGAVRYFTGGEVFDSRAFLHHGIFVQAPGKISVLGESKTGFSFRVDGWRTQPYYIVLTRVWRTPLVKINGAQLTISYPQHEFVGPQYDGRLTLQLPAGTNTVEISYPAVDALTFQPNSSTLKISWPDVKTNLVLQTSDSLSATWTDRIGTPSKSGGNFFVNESLGAPMKFYRLRKQF